MCEVLLGLPDVTVLGIEDGRDEFLQIQIETREKRTGCPACGVIARLKERPVVGFFDLPSFGRPVRLVWRKRRWACPEASCPVCSWTEQDERIAAPRQVLTSRAARWATRQVRVPGKDRQRGGRRARL